MIYIASYSEFEQDPFLCTSLQEVMSQLMTSHGGDCMGYSVRKETASGLELATIDWIDDVDVRFTVFATQVNEINGRMVEIEDIRKAVAA